MNFLCFWAIGFSAEYVLGFTKGLKVEGIWYGMAIAVSTAAFMAGILVRTSFAHLCDDEGLTTPLLTAADEVYVLLYEPANVQQEEKEKGTSFDLERPE
jgi:hypothetical protein